MVESSSGDKMNLFVLSRCPRKNARYHSDVHVVKMFLECIQLLYTCWHVCEPGVAWKDECVEAIGRAPYRSTHKDHPLVQWLCRGPEARYWFVYKNAVAVRILFRFLSVLFALAFFSLCMFQLSEEYNFRYGNGTRVHRSSYHLPWLGNRAPSRFLSHNDAAPSKTVVYSEKGLPPELLPFPLLVGTMAVRPTDTVVRAYRTYYKREKRDIVKWRKARLAPHWWTGEKQTTSVCATDKDQDEMNPL